MDIEKEQVIKKAQRTAQLFNEVSQISTHLISAETDNFYHKTKECVFCQGLCKSGTKNIKCNVSFSADEEIYPLTDKRMFFCNAGFILFAVPVFHNGKMIAVVISEPLRIEADDYLLADDIIARFGFPEEMRDEITKRASALPVFTPEKISAAAELLEFAVFENENSGDLYPAVHRNNLQYLEEDVTLSINEGNRVKTLSLCKSIVKNIVALNPSDLTSAKGMCLEFALLLSRIVSHYDKHNKAFSGRLCLLLKALEASQELVSLRLCMSKIFEIFADSVFCDTQPKHSEAIQKAVDYIEHNYMTKISLDEVAAQVYLSPSYFSRIFKDEEGQSFISYLNNVRIAHAKQLLANEETDLLNVGTIVGYENGSYFSKVFKSITGVTPGKYRAANRKTK